MPGIVAIIDTEEISESLLKSMADSITHETWQKTDFYLESPLGIARVHLGILNPEKQPIFNEDSSAFIFMDGEIYNYEKEKENLITKGHIFKVNNDSEFCLHLFEEYGESFVEKLEGSFIIVIKDIKNERIIITNDRHGLRQLYFTQIDNKCLFSSEVKAILQHKDFKKEIDHEAIAEFFAFGRILEFKTFFKGVMAIRPATMIVWSKGNIAKREYWNFKFQENELKNQEYYLKNLVSFIQQGARKRTKGKQRVGLFLSGGLDSRTVAAALRNATKNISTFTYGVKVNDESKIAQKVANAIGAKHNFVALKKDFIVQYAEKSMYYTDGMMPCTGMWWMNLLPIARENCDVVFHGTCFDILIGTYLSRVSFRHSRDHLGDFFLEKEVTKADPETFLKLLFAGQNGVISSDVAPLFYSKGYYDKVKDYPFNSFKRSFEGTEASDPVSRTDYFFLSSLARIHLSIVLVRNYVEDRFLGFDKGFFDFALTIPRKMRGYKLYYKFLTKLDPDLADLPYQRTGIPPRLPIFMHTIGYLIKGGYKFMAITLKKKTRGLINLPQEIGYPDLNQMVRDSKNRKYFESILLDEKTLSREYFNRAFIIQMVNEHMTNKRNWGEQLCTLLTFELWHRRFIDQPMKD